MEDTALYLERYKKRIGDKYANVSPLDIYEEYESRVKPFLSVITEFKIGEDKVRMRELATALFVSHINFQIMRKVFDELDEALQADKSVMKLKAQLDLQRGLIATEFKNAKLHEMQMIRYDDEYKPKTEAVVEVPPKVTIEFKNASISDEELEDKFDDKFQG